MSQEINTYKNLKFWQTAKEVSLLIVKLVNKLPNQRVYWIISDQMLRSSFSVGANIAEGFGKYKGKEYPRFLQIGLGSARETEYWLELLLEINPKLEIEITKIVELNTQTIKMLIATLNTLKRSSTNH